MSDEYHDSGQYKDSLVQKSVEDTLPKDNGNYPPPGDTTSEGGSGGDALSRRAQRGIDNTNVNSQTQPYAGANSTQGARTPDSFGTSGLQATEKKSTDHSGFEHPSEPSASSRYADRRGETYESAAAGQVDATETGA